MALKSNVYKQKIKKKGHWNYKDLYSFTYDWLKDNGYIVSEEKYSEKVTGAGKDIDIEWTAKRKVTDYFKNVINIKWKILGLKDDVIERAGAKEETNKGEVTLEFKGVLEKDYENRWEDQPFYKFLRGTYEKYIIRTTIDEYEDNVIDDCIELVDQVKAFLEIGGR